ncbi:uncharacterized protein LOC119997132 isoform X2 [Tripterygium wilfordii]|uniref:uncharacterized protein LOC119997132 isoform X2 n=1 Tax=Tripterygium wilfordii TaxID=458696 RepID=UPI0018F8008D|nr:uncharacterized protein LOC119997132 isoform X2 [Tripterygium wilfordii]XP_038699884.1 uncharacterized protein LOC119997132 isoform X2 [Tripterygium wilfordii]
MVRRPTSDMVAQGKRKRNKKKGEGRRKREGILICHNTSRLQWTNMSKMINETEQNSAGIMEEIGKCKDSALERKKDLEEKKERFQKAAYTVLDMLSRRD